jgi:hypothetical protein
VATVTYADARHGLAANQNPQTVTSLNFGTADADRRIVVGISAATDVGVSPDSMTIGGVTATRHANANFSGAFSHVSQLWSAAVPTGTSGTVEFSVPSGDIDGGSVYVWALYGVEDTPADFAQATGAINTIDVSLDVPEGGCVFSVVTVNQAGAASFSFVGVTEDSSDTTPNFQGAAGHAAGVSVGAPRTVTAGPGLSAVSVSFGPGAVVLPLTQGSVQVAGQSVGAALAEALSPSALALTGQSLGFDTRLALDPAAFSFAGSNIGFAYLQLEPASLSFRGQVIDARPLVPSRNRAPLRLPGLNQSVGTRMPSYWKGVRN